MIFTRQPQYAIRLSFNGSLVQPHLFNDAATNARPTFTNAPTITPRINGLARNLVRSAPTQDAYRIAGWSGDFTFFLVGGISGTGGFTQKVATIQTSGGTDRIWFGENSNDRMTLVTVPSGGSTVSLQASGSGADSTGERIWVGRLSGTELTLWRDGVNVGTTTQSGSNWSDVTNHCVGGTAFLQGADGFVALQGFERRAWTDAEIAEFSANPWQLFQINEQPLVNAPASGTELTANNITTAVPTLGSPFLGQTHNLTAANINAGIVDIASPALGQVHALSATGITTGAPDLGSSELGVGSVALTPNDISTGSPILGKPALGQFHVLSATGITTGQPALDAPGLGQAHVLTSVNINTGSPTLGSPSISQSHALTANNINTGNPVLGAPSLNGGLVALDITTGQPVLGNPVLGQTHALNAQGITAAAPSLGLPTLSTGTALSPNNITTGVPTLGSPALGQTHVVIVQNIMTGAVILGTPSLGQIHALSAQSINTGNPSLSAPILVIPTGIRPIEGTYSTLAIDSSYSTMSINADYIKE